MTLPERVSSPDIVIRRFTENDCDVTAVVIDPADAQLTLYATVARDGHFVGSYYCADVQRQADWRVVLPDGNQLLPRNDGYAMQYLTTVVAHTAGKSDRSI